MMQTLLAQLLAVAANTLPFSLEPLALTLAYYLALALLAGLLASYGLRTIYLGLLRWDLPRRAPRRVLTRAVYACASYADSARAAGPLLASAFVWREVYDGAREWYRMAVHAEQLEAARVARHYYRLHNGQPYRYWIQSRDGTLLRVGASLGAWVRFAEAPDAPATLRDLLSAQGFRANADGQWERRT